MHNSVSYRDSLTAFFLQNSKSKMQYFCFVFINNHSALRKSFTRFTEVNIRGLAMHGLSYDLCLFGMQFYYC